MENKLIINRIVLYYINRYPRQRTINDSN